MSIYIGLNTRYAGLSNADEAYWIGPVDDRVRAVVATDRTIIEREWAPGRFECLFSDSDSPDDAAEWGRGTSPDEAFRYALAAYFGPVDDEYPGDAYVTELIEGEGR